MSSVFVSLMVVCCCLDNFFCRDVNLRLLSVYFLSCSFGWVTGFGVRPQLAGAQRSVLRASRLALSFPAKPVCPGTQCTVIVPLKCLSSSKGDFRMKLCVRMVHKFLLSMYMLVRVCCGVQAAAQAIAVASASSTEQPLPWFVPSWPELPVNAMPQLQHCTAASV